MTIITKDTHSCGKEYSIEKLLNTSEGKVREIGSWGYCKNCEVYVYNGDEFGNRKEIVRLIIRKISVESKVLEEEVA